VITNLDGVLLLYSEVQKIKGPLQSPDPPDNCNLSPGRDMRFDTAKTTSRALLLLKYYRKCENQRTLADQTVIGGAIRAEDKALTLQVRYK
jgi:hypothetical protein